MMLELIRIPYRPPRDMLTFLGQEKYGIFALMGIIAAGWSLYVLCDGLRPLPTARDGLAFVALLVAVAAVLTAVVICPPWPVTPLDLICQ